MALRRTCHVLRRSSTFTGRPAPAIHERTAASLQFFSSSSSSSSGRGVEDEEEASPRNSKTKKIPSTSKKSEEKLPRKPTSSQDSNPDSLLIKSLKRQLLEATDLANKFQTEVRGSFKPFEVVPNEGGSDLTLRRIIGKEEVLVKCILDLENPHVEGHTEDASSESDGHDSDDDDNDLRITQRVTMNVQISKGSSEGDQPRMAFLCSYAKGETVSIEDIAYLGESIPEDSPYSGPYFPDLDDNLKQVFQNVIKTRGINSSLADTIMEHLTNQYQNEYLEWLKKIRDFLVR
eukprot:c13747_g1_i1 orf=175-1044(-)